MSFLKDFFLFIYNDLKSDLKFLKDLTKGEAKFKMSKAEFKEEWEKLKFIEIVKEGWLWWIIMIAAFFKTFL